MPHRRPIRLPLAAGAVLGALALLASACSSSSSPKAAAHGHGQGLGQVVLASVRRAPTTRRDATDGGTVIRHVAAQLYLPMTTGATGNATFSPASIAVALAMLRAGGQGRSATQLDRFLGSTDAAALARSMNGLARAFASRNGRFATTDGGHGTVTLRSANALWGQRGVRWQQPFLDTLASQYGAGMRVVDYAAGDTARAAINAWVSHQTSGKIPQLIPAGALTPDSRLTLTNALYFKAPWDHALTAAGTKPFTTAAGTREQAPAMTESTDLAYARGRDWQSVTLPYVGDHEAMTLVVPDAGHLASVESALPTGLLDQVLAGGGASRQVELTMPKFDLRTKSSLKQVLEALGVTAPFDPQTPDFAPMSHDPNAEPLSVSDVHHEATVTVDEKGTVAAAATSVEMRATSARVEPEPPVVVTVDRPFLFVIEDVATGAPLFVGRVSDPLQK